jgi:hypothetical protein
MGANAQIAVPSFTAGQVLTAAQQTQINTGIPVFATTVTRDAAFGGTGEKVLAQGQYAYIEATSTLQVYNGSAWVTAGGGLTYLTGASFSGATTVSLPASTFTSAYRNYRLIFQMTSTTTDANITMRLRAAGSDITTTNYDVAFIGISNLGGSGNAANVSQTAWDVGQIDSGAPWCYMVLDVIAPQVATNTFITGQVSFVETTGAAYITRNGSGVFRLTTSVDALTVISSVASSITGVYRVYGYSES